MKKLLTSILLLMILVGCATEDTPEYYFDTALTKIENATVLETEMTVINQDGKELYYISYEKDGLVRKRVGTEHPDSIEIDENFEDNMTQITRFYYGDIFNDFSMEDNVVICTMPVNSSEQIVQTAKLLTDEDISSITHYMYFEDEELDYVEIIVQAKTQTLTYTISLLNIE